MYIFYLKENIDAKCKTPDLYQLFLLTFYIKVSRGSTYLWFIHPATALLYQQLSTYNFNRLLDLRT